MTLAAWEIKALVEGDHEDVFGVLGPHVVETALAAVAVAVRALLPQASRVRVIPVLGDLAPRAMERSSGIWRREPWSRCTRPGSSKRSFPTCASRSPTASR